MDDFDDYDEEYLAHIEQIEAYRHEYNRFELEGEPMPEGLKSETPVEPPKPQADPELPKRPEHVMVGEKNGSETKFKKVSKPVGWWKPPI